MGCYASLRRAGGPTKLKHATDSAYCPAAQVWAELEESYVTGGRILRGVWSLSRYMVTHTTDVLSEGANGFSNLRTVFSVLPPQQRSGFGSINLLEHSNSACAGDGAPPRDAVRFKELMMYIFQANNKICSVILVHNEVSGQRKNWILNRGLVGANTIVIQKTPVCQIRCKNNHPGNSKK